MLKSLETPSHGHPLDLFLKYRKSRYENRTLSAQTHTANVCMVHLVTFMEFMSWTKERRVSLAVGAQRVGAESCQGNELARVDSMLQSHVSSRSSLILHKAPRVPREVPSKKNARNEGGNQNNSKRRNQPRLRAEGPKFSVEGLLLLQLLELCSTA